MRYFTQISLKIIQAVVGVLRRSEKVLIAKRRPSQFMGEYWEFPGGKIELGELPKQALIRELKEELGVLAKTLKRMRTVFHTYHDRTVHLQVFLVDEFSGEPQGLEGQEIAWIDPSPLPDELIFLPTAHSIFNALVMPRLIRIIPFEDYKGVLEGWQGESIQLKELFLLRSQNEVSNTQLERVVKDFASLNLSVVLNIPNKSFNPSQAKGWHLTSAELNQHKDRPCSEKFLLGASVHNAQQLASAEALRVDYVLLSPVKKTLSHPEAEPLGLSAATSLAKDANCLVFFLGGMSPSDLLEAVERGVHGVAGIRGFN